ncbi:MAG: hypothetical protein ACI8ZM_005558 [Crocinitomix sp.]|jgi:hypothetical protein
MSPANELLIYCGIGFLFIIASFVFLRIRRETHLNKYEMNYHKLKRALAHKDIEKINHFGMLLLWNENMEKKAYFDLKESVDQLILDNPNLSDLQKKIDQLFEKQMWLINLN